jgi:hypothetical protein
MFVILIFLLDSVGGRLETGFNQIFSDRISYADFLRGAMMKLFGRYVAVIPIPL